MQNDLINKTLGQLGSLGKQTVKAVVKVPKDVVEGAVEQTGVKPPEPVEEQALTDEQKQKQNSDFVNDLYGLKQSAEKNPEEKNPAPITNALGIKKAESQKTPEEEQELAQLRQTLHSDYYQKLTNPPKQQEEKPAERVERLQMEDLQKEQKKKEKPGSQAIRLASQKVEKYPGASG